MQPVKKWCLWLTLFVCCSLKVFTQGQTPDYTPLIEKYRKIFAEEMQQNHLAGMSIALVDGNKVVWAEGFGWYDSASKKTVTPETPFHIGSVCKTFTGIAIMQLQQAGKLNINDPLKKYLPEFNLRSLHGRTDTISLRSIMSHHAGIPDFIIDKFSANPPDFKRVIDMVNDDYATQKPYTHFSYSNAGISLLGNVIEKISGMSYYDYIRKKILEPLNMKNTGFVKGTGDPASVSFGYNLQGIEKTELAVWDAPAGCIYASATDMAKFIQAHLAWGAAGKARIFDSTTLVRMTQVENGHVFADLAYTQGLVWKLYRTDGGWGIQHDGGTLFHRAELSIVPDAGIGLVMLSNSSSGKPLQHTDYDIINEAIRIKGKQIPDAYPAVVRNLHHPEHAFSYNGATKTPAPVFTTLSDDTLKYYAGYYGTFGALFTITAEKNALKVQVMNQIFYLLPVEKNEFVPAGANNRMMIRPDMRMYFDSVDSRIVLIQCDTWGTQNIMAEKLPAPVMSAAWKKRLGKWKMNGKEPFQLISDAELVEKDGQLLLSNKFNIEMPGIEGDRVEVPLRILSDSMAITVGFSRFAGQALQVIRQPDGHEVLKTFGYMLQKD
jgi:CubicO group peptidase (beta-lactamase class C family)